MTEPVYRKFEFDIQQTDDNTVELINLLSQAVFSYREELTEEQLDSVALWFEKRFKGVGT